MKDSTYYVLVTPTKNEEALIGETIKSVISQTIQPKEWIIVSDGSTDRTEEIARSASRIYPWIRLLQRPPRTNRNFAAVVHATEAGVQALSIKEYDYIGLLDSDLRFDKDYFQKVIEHFEKSPRLGLAGGVVIDPGQPKNHLPRNRQDVPGAVQFFRRECFETLGGLIPVPEGGWDGLSCAKARMDGYETKILTDLVVNHLKPRNIAEGGTLRRKWQMGVRDYSVGYHPVFEAFKCLSRIFESPLFGGAAAWWIGYCWAATLQRKQNIPSDLLSFIRTEQKRRLFKYLSLPT